MMGPQPESRLKTLQIVGNARYGGATLIMLEWARYLRALGCTVDVLCTDPRMKDEVRAMDGVGLIDDIVIPKEIRPGADIRALRALHKVCRTHEYDVVHTYTATPSFLGRFAASAARVPVVVNHQGGWAVNETSALVERFVYTPLEYLGTLACTRNICVSNSERKKAVDLHLAPARKLVTIVNGIDTTDVLQAIAGNSRQSWRSSLGCSEGTVLIGTTGRLVAGKGNASAIEALAHVRQRAPHIDVRLALAGDGEQRSELEELVEQHGLGDKVEFLGFVSDIPGFLASLDVFATPTHTEGLSMSLLEAMAAAVPVIATSIPANAEVITDGQDGLLVEVDSPEQIAAAIIEIANDVPSARRMALSAQRLVETDYSMARMFRQTWELYCELATSAGLSVPDRATHISEITGEVA